jgi:hypothetical protein
MMELHNRMQADPESQHEIYFHQRYGYIIREAENYLRQYVLLRDHIAMDHAWEIYTRIFRDIEQSMKLVENVPSPLISASFEKRIS